ncbi:hypothetical protein ACX0G7_01915 [Flavitalea antarctica]
MKSNFSLRFTVMSVGFLSLGFTAVAQASEKPASELYANVVRNRQMVKPITSSDKLDPKNLASEQQIPNARTPRFKEGPNVGFVPPKSTEPEEKRKLPSNAVIPKQKFEERKKPVKPVVPTPQEGVVTGQ